MIDAEKPDPIFEKINQDNLMSLRLVDANSQEVCKAFQTGTPSEQWDRVTTLLMHARELERWLQKYYDAIGGGKTEERKLLEEQKLPSKISQEKLVVALTDLSAMCRGVELGLRGISSEDTKKVIAYVLEIIRRLRDPLKSYLYDLTRKNPNVAPDHIKKMWLDRA